MRAGIALYLAGLSRAKHAASTVLRCLLDFWTIVIVFWAIGAGIRFGTGMFLSGSGSPNAAMVEVLASILIVSAIAPSAISERSRLWLVPLLAALLCGLILPMTSRLVDLNGVLGRRGFVDLAGASWLALPAGILGIVAAGFVGPRQGKFNRDGSSNAIPGHNLPLAGAGLLLMFMAWGLYVLAMAPLERLPLVMFNLLLAGSAGGLSALMYCRYRYGKAEIFFSSSALIASLIAISAGAAVVSPLAAILIGIISGLLAPLAILTLDLRLRIDDPAGLSAVAVVGGVVGPVMTGILVRPTAVVPQLLGVAMLLVIALAISLIAMLILKFVFRLRSSEADEYDGLDIAEHDLNAYPDFQQTMIKSYHLRET